MFRGGASFNEEVQEPVTPPVPGGEEVQEPVTPPVPGGEPDEQCIQAAPLRRNGAQTMSVESEVGMAEAEDDTQESQRPSLLTSEAAIAQETPTTTPAALTSNEGPANFVEGSNVLALVQRQLERFKEEIAEQVKEKIAENIESVSQQLSHQAQTTDKILRFLAVQRSRQTAEQDEQTSSSTAAPSPPVPYAKGGGGRKKNRVLTDPFSKELRTRMGMGSHSKEWLPNYPSDEAWPVQDGKRLVRLNWARPYDCEENRALVRRIIRELRTDPSHSYSQLQDDALERVYGLCLETVKHRYEQRRREEKMSIETKARYEQQKRRKRRLADKKKMRRKELGLESNQDIARKYGPMCDAIVEAASEDETEDDQPGSSGNSAALPCERKGRLVLQSWRSQELEQVIRLLDQRHKARVAGVGRQLLRAQFATDPPADASVSPIPNIAYRWMVSRAFVNRFRHLTHHVRANILTVGGPMSMQWGTDLSCEVRTSSVQPLQDAAVSSSDDGAVIGTAFSEPSAVGRAYVDEQSSQAGSWDPVMLDVEAGSPLILDPALSRQLDENDGDPEVRSVEESNAYSQSWLEGGDDGGRW